MKKRDEPPIYHCDIAFAIEGTRTGSDAKRIRSWLLKWMKVFDKKFTVVHGNPELDITVEPLGKRKFKIGFVVIGRHFMAAKSGRDCALQVERILKDIYNQFDAALTLTTKPKEAIQVRRYNPAV